jgi:hypothetical protein
MAQSIQQAVDQVRQDASFPGYDATKDHAIFICPDCTMVSPKSIAFLHLAIKSGGPSVVEMSAGYIAHSVFAMYPELRN